jgi:3-hydroxyacyl-CoA dehydrogenase
MAELVRLERHGDIGVIVIDHPPVNALSSAVRRGLVEALAELGADGSLRAGVLTCAGRTFVAGADIREFDTPPPGAATTNDVCRALDHCPKPVVAALFGTTLGGGLEIALACHARVISPDGSVGLPEVKIGLLPGAGGTQRLPRLIGALAALEMISTGRHVPAAEALQLGIVDEIGTDIRGLATERARAMAQTGEMPRARDRAVPALDRAAFDSAVEAVKRKARGAVAPGRAAEAVSWAIDLPFDEALAKESATFHELRTGAQSKALRHIFMAERAAAKPPKEQGGEASAPWPIKVTGVVGGGTMGSGIAIALADAGLKVTLVEITDEAVAAARKRIAAVYDRQAKSGRLSAEEHTDRLHRIHFSTNVSALSDADLVVEAIIENMDAKQEMFRRLSAATRRNAILASNTSYLDIEKMADVVDNPERVIGLHFFSPAHVMRLLEIVRPRRASPAVLATALALAKRIRKQPVIAGVCDGFIGNRIFAHWRMQCDFALEDGALPHEVDRALEAYGMAMGPFAVADLAGLDIGWANRKRLAPTRNPAARYVPIADWLCEAGRFGQKTGAGWYLHENGKREIDPAVAELVERASAARGIVRHPVPAERIQTRVLAAMINEAAKILGEGIASRPSDIDVVLVHGYGFPSWRGGPMHAADTLGLEKVLEVVREMHAESGPGWEPAPLLEQLVNSGRNFAALNQ